MPGLSCSWAAGITRELVRELEPGEVFLFDMARLSGEGALSRATLRLGADMSKHREMIEGGQAFKRFRDAMKSILSVPKSALPAKAKKKQPKRKKS